jgi:hypothetical protein
MSKFSELNEQLNNHKQEKIRLEKELSIIPPDEIWMTLFEGSNPGFHLSKVEADAHYKSIQKGIFRYTLVQDAKN